MLDFSIANPILLQYENIHQNWQNHDLWQKQCHNDMLIENIAPMNAIIFAR
jgi:hypothetical protein